MPKKLQKNKGAFLASELSPTKWALVRREFPAWHDAFKKKFGPDENMGTDLLDDFVDHLGYKDHMFRNVPAEMLNIKNIGTRQIYDYMRKRVGKVDERAPTGRGVNDRRKITPAKEETPQTPLKTATSSPDAVQVTADGHLHLGDEKVVAYR